MDEDYMDDEPRQVIRMESFQPFFGWVGVICAGLITAAICWNAAAVVQLKSDVAVLVARPEGISRAEYLRDQNRYEHELAELQQRLGQRK